MVKKKTVKKEKLEVVFDPKKRKEFLSGFHKRKNERRKRAQEQLDKNLKAERKRIAQEIKDGFKHMKKSFEPLRELTAEDRAEDEQEYEDDDVKVRIVELNSATELAAKNTLIGLNQEENEEESEEENMATEEESALSTVNIKGFDDPATQRSQVARARAGAKPHKPDDASTKAVKKIKIDEKELKITNKKDLNRLVKQKTIKKIQKSKIFKQKERIDKRANDKKLKRSKNNSLKSMPKYARKKLKNEPSRYSKGRMLSKKQFRKKKQNME